MWGIVWQVSSLCIISSFFLCTPINIVQNNVIFRWFYDFYLIFHHFFKNFVVVLSPYWILAYTQTIKAVKIIMSPLSKKYASFLDSCSTTIRFLCFSLNKNWRVFLWKFRVGKRLSTCLNFCQNIMSQTFFCLEQ